MRTMLHLLLLTTVLLAGCDDSVTNDRSVLRLAVTTSTRDSGLLELLVPLFEAGQQVRVDVIAVGTGAALRMGERGDVDAVLVHARQAEEAFMKAGHGSRREDLMFNTFEILGPKDDPACIGALSPAAALQQIARQQHGFVSRGDDSGTHKRELKLWKDGGGMEPWDSYLETGQGQGATLTIANQKRAYALTDRGTYLRFKSKLALIPLVRSSPALHNEYGILVVNSARHAGVNEPVAQAFVDFMVSPEVQWRIGEYEIDGERLFHPLRLPTKK